MPLTNVLLVRHQTGHSTFFRGSSFAAHGWREGFLSLGDLSKSQAEPITEAIFDRIAEAQTAFTATYVPVGADVPYVDYTVGDTITCDDRDNGTAEVKVLAMTVRENPVTGRPEFTPELNVLTQDRAERHEEWLKRMANGAMRGTIAAASPFGEQPTLGAKVPPAPEIVFDLAGLLSDNEGVDSNVWPLLRSTQLTLWVAALVGIGTTDSEIEVLVNGAVVGTITIAAGETWASAEIDVGLTPPDDQLQVRVATAGDGAVGLTVAGYREAI